MHQAGPGGKKNHLLQDGEKNLITFVYVKACICPDKDLDCIHSHGLPRHTHAEQPRKDLYTYEHTLLGANAEKGKMLTLGV